MNFRDWLQSEIGKRKISYSEIGRRGGISHARISQVLAGEPPGRAFCIGLARAFDMEANEVLEMAGHPHLEANPDNGPLSGNGRELMNVYHQLSEDGRRTVYRFATWQLEEEQQAGN